MNFTVDLPIIKDVVYNITAYGAVSGGIISNTAAINSAIKDAFQNGGGHVVIPQGIWLTGPIELLSGIDLHLEKGALLLFSKSKEEYPLIITDYEGVKHIRAVSPISACKAENISITGDGVIDGNGHLWRICKEFKFTRKEWERLLKKSPDTYIEINEGRIWFPTRSAYEGYKAGEPNLDNEEEALKTAAPFYDFYRPVMVDLKECNRILIEGVTLENSPAWNVHPIFCTNVTIRNAYIRNADYAQNGDGLDLESCRYVEIYNVKFDVGDDAICMKSGKNKEARKIEIPTEDVYIHDCVVLHGHGGFVVGSEMSRGVRNVLVENCTFIGTDVGIRFKSAIGRGGVVEDITLNNINMINIPNEAIIFTMGYVLATFSKSEEEVKDKFDKEDIPEFKNITIKNISCLHAGVGLKIEGLTELPIHDITLENVDITTDKNICISNARNIILKNVIFRNTTGEKEEYKNEILNSSI